MYGRRRGRSMYRVYRSDQYQHQFEKCDHSQQQRIETCEKNIQQQPYASKPLGYRFLREKKFDGKRTIFLIYEKEECLFLVTICNKKTQQKEIDIIKSQLSWYEEEIQTKVKELF